MPRKRSVNVYYRKREQYWTVRWRDPYTSKQREHGAFTTEDEAQDYATQVRRRIREGLPGVREPVTIHELIQHWWDSYVTNGAVQAATRETYRTDAKRILETLGDHSAYLTTDEIREWRDTLAKQHSPRAANKAHTALSSAYEHGRKARSPLVEANPCHGLKRLPEPPARMIIPSRTQIRLLADTAPSDRELAMLLIASRCGLRQSELLGLAWENIGSDAVWIRQVADRGRVLRQSAKTRLSERRVPMPPSVQAALRAIRPANKRSGLVFPGPTDPTKPIQRAAWRKTYWTPWRLNAAWTGAKQGLDDEWPDLVDLQWKNLRHHAISRWFAADAKISQVSRWSGDSLKTIDRHYAHLMDDDEADVMRLVD